MSRNNIKADRTDRTNITMSNGYNKKPRRYLIINSTYLADSYFIIALIHQLLYSVHSNQIMFQVNFVVYAKAQQDQNLYIVGNLPQLGGWSPDKGLRLIKYDDNQYQSHSLIDVPVETKFEFKIVKMNSQGTVIWEQLPNNSNRKFKPRHHSRLVLTWSNHIGNIINEGKSACNVNGMPGVIMGNVKQTGILKQKSKFDPHKQATNNDSSSSQDENDSFSSVCAKNKLIDIRVSISKQDVQEIYYQASQIYKECENEKKKKIYLISTEDNNAFLEKLQNEIQQLRDSEEMQIKWLHFSQEPTEPKNNPFNARHLISEADGAKILKQIDHERFYVIFLDVSSAVRAKIPERVSACLYLSSNKYQEVITHVQALKSFAFICFNEPQNNKQLYQFFQSKQQLPLSTNLESEKQFSEVTLNKIIEELHFSRLPSKSVNTIHTFIKSDALHNIQCDNSILIVDSSLMYKDLQFFNQLIDNKRSEKRLIIIINHESKQPEWIKPFKDRHDVCVIFNNFQNLYLFGKVFCPIKSHQQMIDFLKYKANFYANQYGGSFTLTDNSLTLRLKDTNSSDVFRKISDETNLFLRSHNYFKISLKNNKFKLSWALAPKIRIIRTICRIKSIEEGKIDKIFLVSCENDFSSLRKQIKVMMKYGVSFLNGASAKVYDFGYGNKVNTNYKIGKDTSQKFIQVEQ